MLREPLNDPNQQKTQVKSSIFGGKECEITWAWLMFTGLYWIIIIWIHTIRDMYFASNGFILWCIGFIAWMSCVYTCYEGKYPSGSTSSNMSETNGIGRYSAAFLTSTVIIDVCMLMWIIIIDDDYYDDTLDSLRLSFHCIHILWASLFFYNTFYTHHAVMATRAFFIEWADIIWTVIVAAQLRYSSLAAHEQLNGVHYTYFIFITVSLCGWMLPMMLIRNWGASEYARIVSLHLLILDLIGDIPVIIVLFSYGSYKQNTMLFMDVFWKTFIIVRSISYYIVNLYIFKTSAGPQDNRAGNNIDSNNGRKIASLLWIIYVTVYWTLFTLIETVSDNEIASKYQYYTWFGGMIGIMCVYDTWSAGYHATTTRGRRMLAFACTCICTDWILLSARILRDGSTWSLSTVMVLHAIAVLWALIFFYRYADVLNEAWLSLLFEWIDIIFMYIATVVLHDELGSCVDDSICVGYVVIASIKLYLWFLPIMYHSADTEWRLHIHMVVLDTLTDLPLIIVLITSEAYSIHPFIMFDLIVKLLMLLRTYAYHLVINLVLKRVELNEKHKLQLQEAFRDNGDMIQDVAL